MMAHQFTSVFSGLLPCDCKKCKNWDGVSDIVCESITCVCENAVVVKCEILSTPRYVCADLRCAFNIDADNKYFKEYTRIMGECQRYLDLYVDKKLTCVCGVALKASVEHVMSRGVHLGNETQVYFICRDGGCDYKRSIPQLKDLQSRIRCVCGRYCEHDGEVYKCPRGEDGCGTYFHELDSLTYMHTVMLQDELEDCVWAYLPINVKRLECGHYGVLKYVSRSENRYGRLMLVCKHLFCDCRSEAVIAPEFTIDE